MRVIAGEFKGRKLEFISEENLRPTADIVKQALFTKLQFMFPVKAFLDVFAGTGSIGIEALSRGAEKVVFIEKNVKHSKIIEKNFDNLKIAYSANINAGEKAILIKDSFENALNHLDCCFDIIFIDPPYKSNYYEVCLNIIKEKSLLSDDGIIVLEHDNNKKIDFCGFKLVSEKRYGKRVLTYLAKT